MKQQKCFEIINCPYNSKTAPEGMTCPVYDQQCTCWEFDWPEFYTSLPEGTGREEWRCGMIECCNNCQVYKSHKPAMDNIFKQLK